MIRSAGKPKRCAVLIATGVETPQVLRKTQSGLCSRTGRHCEDCSLPGSATGIWIVLEAVFLGKQRQRIERFAAIGAVVIDGLDLLALELVETAFLFRDIIHHGRGFAVEGHHDGEDIGENATVGRFRAPIGTDHHECARTKRKLSRIAGQEIEAEACKRQDQERHAVQNVQERAFSGAIRADQCADFFTLDLKRKVGNRLHALEGQRDISDFQGCHWGCVHRLMLRHFSCGRHDPAFAKWKDPAPGLYRRTVFREGAVRLAVQFTTLPLPVRSRGSSRPPSTPASRAVR
jgi:hypothetical protein